MSTVPTPIWVDCDPGVDDALALLYLAHHPDAQLVGISTVHGNVSAVLGAQNAQRTLDAAGLTGVPVLLGVDHPLVDGSPTAEDVHGRDGLGEAALAPPSQPPTPGLGPLALIEWTRAHPGVLTLLAIGPLTNVALALRLEPRLTTWVPRLVIMGGAVYCPGNTTAAAEFNILHDPEAAEVVFASGWNITLVGLDVTRQALLAGPPLEQLERAAPPRARFATAILQRYLARHQQQTGVRGGVVHDAVAAALAVDPTLGAYEMVPVAVERTGSATRGATVPIPHDYERPALRVAVNLASERFLDEFVHRLTGDPPTSP